MSKWLRPGSGLLIVFLLLCLTVTPALAAPAAQGSTVHVVSAGENLNNIANRYGTTVSAIASANSLASANFIYVGQRLTIPGASAGSTTSAGGVHVVGYGESLTSIALRYGTTVWAIASANGLSNPNFVYSGQRLKIPGASTTSTSTPTTATSDTHIVQAGQTLASIGTRYGVTAGAIASANGIVNSNLIYVGQKLTIPAAGSTSAQNPAPAPAASIAGRWIDINLSTQSLVAYEGDTPVYWVTVSTGLSGTPTVTGTYKIYSKYPAIAMSGPGYYLPNVPWTMFFFRGYAIHGAYWHNNFGVPMSHGCVNTPIADGEWLYNFASIGTPVVIHY